MEENITQANKKHSLHDAALHSVMLGAGETYFGAFAIFLNATALQLGVLATFPAFLGAISQSISVWLTEVIKRRRKIMVMGAFSHATMLLPIALLPILPISDHHKVVLLIILVALYFLFSGIVSPAWNSLIGDLIPVDERAIFFAKRNQYAGITMFLATVIAGMLLDGASLINSASLGFFTIFVVAAAARMLSARELSRHQDIAYEVPESDKFSFWDFIRRSPWSNFAKFVFFFASIQFGVSIAGPYFSLYMLRDLQFSYFEFTLVTASAVVSQLFALKNWGAISQSFGNRRILAVCGHGVALIPLLWLLNDNIWYLIVIQIYSGFVWSGFNLAAQNFMFDAVKPAKRARCAAYQAIVNGFFVLTGSLIGAALIPHLTAINVAIKSSDLHASNLLYLFLISGIVRLLSTLVFLPMFKEVREVKPSTYPEIIFRVSHIRPISGMAYSIIPLGRKLKTKEQKKIKNSKADDNSAS